MAPPSARNNISMRSALSIMARNGLAVKGLSQQGLVLARPIGLVQ